MTSAIARVFAVAAVLAATAACGGGGEDSGQAQTSPTGAAENGTGQPTSEADRLASVFVGSDSEGSSASAITLQRTEPGKAVEGDVHVEGPNENPAQLQNLRWDSEEAQGEVSRKCVGQTLPCDVGIKVTPMEAGPYSGELTFTMDDGSSLSVPVSGEAVGDTDPTSAPPVGPTTTEPAPETPTEVPTEVPTDEVPTDIPDEYEIP